MKRRHFIKAGAAAAGTLLFDAFPYHAFAGTTKKFASDKVILGDTGIEVSRLAMGTGTNGYANSSNQKRKLGLKGLTNLLRTGYDEGVFFWESADQYGTHPHLKEALKAVDREKVVLLTKTHARTEKEMKADLDRFRKEMGTDYIDMVLLHALTNPRWNENRKGAMEYLSRAREDGIIRAHGVSCHSLGALQTAADEPWVQVDLARMNPAGVRMDAEVPTVVKVLQNMKAKGKGVIGMKILGGGQLRGKVDEALQYALAQEYLDSFTIGSESIDEFQELTRKIPAASVRG
ncbi:Aldo/keto reductase family protein [Tangfeifania diversioriginum]|uniref:Aldo/keto reductase family protein n=1 Tax=Tangfeifania diversioriginum TaxID=1168035 RepID=A0A1M6GAC7_9BACT|nr:aldo/keto reductase [Tangfeifania diversioriginum]SHJ06872.1 Aldo/keto reductase family protein [Tangfeifania diversioriginum]